MKYDFRFYVNETEREKVEFWAMRSCLLVRIGGYFCLLLGSYNFQVCMVCTPHIWSLINATFSWIIHFVCLRLVFFLFHSPTHCPLPNDSSLLPLTLSPSSEKSIKWFIYSLLYVFRILFSLSFVSGFSLVFSCFFLLARPTVTFFCYTQYRWLLSLPFWSDYVVFDQFFLCFYSHFFDIIFSVFVIWP